MNVLFNTVMIVSVLLTVGILLSFVYFGFQRRQHLQKSQKVQTYIEEHQTSWYDYLVHQIPFTKPLHIKNQTELQGIEAILFSYSRNVSDKTVRAQISRFANDHLKAEYRNRLKSRRWNVRMNALYRVGTFGITELLPEVQKMMKKPKSNEEYFRILTIYSHYLPDEFFAEFFKVQENFTEYQFKRLFSVMTHQTRYRMSDSFQKISSVGQYATIDLLGKRREFASLAFLTELLDSPDSEIRIRALKAIHEIRMIIDVERIMPFAESDIWQERLLVARLFENLSSKQVNSVYLKLIEDSNWWVRNEAARVLSVTKEGRRLLEAVVEHSTDPYAVDVSKSFLLRGV